MTKIRREITTGNPQGRVACQVQHCFSAAVFYVTIEYGHVVAKDFGKRVIGRDGDPVTLTPTGICADFEFPYSPNPGRLIATVGGFPANSGDSGIETFMFDVHL